MDVHMEYELRLKTEPEHKSLYRWAINEIDPEGREIGGDRIPWPWSLYFTATDCALHDHVDVQPKSAFDARLERALTESLIDGLPPRESSELQVIMAQLRPGDRRHDQDIWRKTRFSMFGTRRAIEKFELRILPNADPADEEICKAFGSVAYNAADMESAETAVDWLQFVLFVKPTTFDRYAAKVSNGFVEDMVFRVGRVAGFYSHWSPSIDTSEVKVLTSNREHKLSLPTDLPFEPQSLGTVGEANLFISQRVNLGGMGEKHLVTLEGGEPVTTEIVSEARVAPAVDPRTLRVLVTLRSAVWLVAVLLALVLITSLLD